MGMALAEDSTKDKTQAKDQKNDFFAGLTQSFILIFLSEIGDRTFILVTIYAAKFNFCVLFLVSITGMYSMHILSTVLGATILPLLISQFWTEVICIVLFFGMGFFMLYQYIKNPEVDEDNDDDRKEIEMKIRKHEEKIQPNKPIAIDSQNTIEIDSES